MMKGLMHKTVHKYMYFTTQQRKSLSIVVCTMLLSISLYTSASKFGDSFVVEIVKIFLKCCSTNNEMRQALLLFLMLSVSLHTGWAK